MKNLMAVVMFSVLLLSISSCKKGPCGEKVCLNGGTCEDGNCYCVNGYTGASCETMDSCLNVTCLNGGHCAGGLCVCPPGYSGANCSLQVFTIEDDKEFGLQMEYEIAANPASFPLLSPSHSAYNYLNAMKQDILNAGQVEHGADFAWKINIIQNDTVLNAFCTPGGYIYIYTGLLKYLVSASSIAGVMAHVMAHADRRHTTQQLTAQYGLAQLVKVVAGTASAGEVWEIAGTLPILTYSRDQEREADEYSVKYLCPTKYHAEGATYFFSQLEADGHDCSSLEAFFSTHPCPENRITNIQSNTAEQNCAANNNISASEDIGAYNAFKASLP